MKKFVSCFLFLLCATMAWADEPGWTQPCEIKSIHVQPNGNINVCVTVDVPNLGCQLWNNGWLQLDLAAANLDKQYALLLAAHMAGKKVRIYVSGCGPSYPLAQNTEIVP